ncbi:MULTISPECIES: hypothetical protein [unclassified Streptomyces]|nr:hypothetical protein OG452_32935 [Streptomyces sp. NBC_01197]WSS47497.1 hypothetical protein OG708_01910 [Streptomyces sp. NBC_01180]
MPRHPTRWAVFLPLVVAALSTDRLVLRPRACGQDAVVRHA